MWHPSVVHFIHPLCLTPISCFGFETAGFLFDRRKPAHDVKNKDKVLPNPCAAVCIVSVEDFPVIQHLLPCLFRVVWYPEAGVA